MYRTSRSLGSSALFGLRSSLMHTLHCREGEGEGERYLFPKELQANNIWKHSKNMHLLGKSLNWITQPITYEVLLIDREVHGMGDVMVKGTTHNQTKPKAPKQNKGSLCLIKYNINADWTERTSLFPYPIIHKCTHLKPQICVREPFFFPILVPGFKLIFPTSFVVRWLEILMQLLQCYHTTSGQAISLCWALPS